MSEETTEPVLELAFRTPSPNNSSASLPTCNPRSTIATSPVRATARPTGRPTKFPAPPPQSPLHRHTASRPTTKISVPSTIPLATFPATHPPADPAAAPPQILAASKSAPATAQSAYKIRTPHRKTTTPVHADLFHPCTHSPGKSWFYLNPTHRSSRLLLIAPQQRNHLASQFPHALQRAHRHPQNLFEQAAHRRQEIQHALQPFPRVRIALWPALRFLHALGEYSQRGINLPPLPLLRHGAKNLPNIFGRLEMVAPVAQHMHHPHNSPPL